MLSDPNATFWEGGKEIPVALVPANKIDANTLMAYETDGTLHVLITPQVSGTQEAIEKAAQGVTMPTIPIKFGWQPTAQKVDWGETLNSLLGGSTIDMVKTLNSEVKYFGEHKDDFLGFWNVFDVGKKGVEGSLKTYLSGDTLAGLQAYVSEVVAAVKTGQAVSETDIDNLQSILVFVETLEVEGVGENIVAGIGDAMAAAGWEDPAETTAGNLESAVNSALGIQSPSTRMVPTGENAAAGIGQGFAAYDFTAEIGALAASLIMLAQSHLSPLILYPYGLLAATGLGLGMLSFNPAGAVGSLTDRIRNALTNSLNIGSLHGIGQSAMAGLSAGILAGESGVVSAMTQVARAAVNAAKRALLIKSPSRVFQDEIGRMTMKGWGQGVLKESRTQAKVVSNAARYLTDTAKTSSIAYAAQDNRRTYNQSSAVNLTGNTFHIRDDKDVQSLAIEIAALTRRQHLGQGLRGA